MTARARRMLDALEDGCRTRDQLYAHAGRFFLTNNAAAELRAAGIPVTYLRVGGQDTYTLLDERDDPLEEAVLPLVEEPTGQFSMEVAA